MSDMQPDDNELSPERKTKLRAAYEANVAAGKAPYAGVPIRTRGELNWVMCERRWSGEFNLPEASERANLSGANLISTDLRNTSLQSADLSGASLVQAYLDGADLRGADLCEANFDMASMGHVMLAGADLRGARLTDVWLAGADLRETHLDHDATSQLLGACIACGPGKLPHIDWTVLSLSALKWGEVFYLAEKTIVTLQVMQREGALVVLPEDENGVPVLGDPGAQLVKIYRKLARSYQHLAAIWQEHGLDAYANRLRRRAGVMRSTLVRWYADPDEEEGPDQGAPNEDVRL